MKILHLGWGYPPRYMFGGPVYYLHRLALLQRARGHDVTIACASDLDRDGAPPWSIGEAEFEDVPYIHLVNRSAHMYRLGDPAGETLDVGCETAFLHVLEEQAPDLLHVHNLVGLCLTLPRLARQRGVPVVMSLHNYWPLCPRVDLFQADQRACDGPSTADCGACLGTDVSPDAYRDRHAAAIAALGSCDSLIAVSTRVKEIYVEHGVDPDLIEVGRIGSDAAAGLWETIGRARLDDPPPERPEFVFFGSQVANKGGHVILEALGRMRNASGYSFRFFGAAGGSAYGDIVQARLTALGPRADNVQMTGHYTQDELPGLLGAADVAVLTPQWEDNGPQTVFESLGAGLPVVGTRMGGIPDVVRDGENGFLVPPADPGALAEVLDRIVDDPSVVCALRRGLQPPMTMEGHADDLDRTYARAASVHRPTPQVSVLLRATGERDALVRSLVALSEATPDGTYEVLVVDEATTDGTRELLSQIEGDLRAITHTVPGSARDAVIEAAAAARADTAVVLAPGGELAPGWLERALDSHGEVAGIDASGASSGRPLAVVAPTARLADPSVAEHAATLAATR